MAWNTKEVIIESIVSMPAKEEVFDIEMPEHHNFFANGILAHNCHMVDWADVLEDNPESQYGVIIKTMMERNSKLRIIGYTGSPFRGVEPILGQFWKRELIKLDTSWLIERGFLVPQIFGYGHDDAQYDLSEFKPQSQDGTNDFTAQQLRDMEKKILSSHTTTQKIMIEVQELAKHRNGVLITCAGKKHCEEAASMLPAGSYGIVTDSTPKKQRADILKNAKSGKLKYVLQIGCLTTGVNIPRWDTVVILRQIGSLTLLVQLIGRGLRLPDETFNKNDCLVLDYSGTMHSMGALYHNPILEQAELQRAKFTGDMIHCPICNTENSMYARRCIGADPKSIDGRCEHFWMSKQCKECGTLNDTAARDCRRCDAQLVDPNEKLTGKHYTDNDLINVLSMSMTPTKNMQGLVITYMLENGDEATEIHWPFSENNISRKLWKLAFVFKHVADKKDRSKVLKFGDIKQIMGAKELFMTPKMITHRVNAKGKSIINRKVFDDDNQ